MDAVQPAQVARESLLITTWALTGTAVAFFLCRLGIRRRFTSRLWLDDWISGAATCFLFAQAMVTSLMVNSMYETLRYSNTMSKLQHDVAALERREVFSLATQSFMRSQFAQMVCFWTCIWLVKGSFLTLCFRLLPTHSRAFTTAWWIIAGLAALFYVVTIISFPIACSALSPPFCSGGHSINLSQVSLRLSTALDIITNIFIIALPIALVFSINFPKRTTITLVTIFSSVSLIIIMSILRLTSSQGNEADWPEVTALNLWSAIEAAVAVIIVNVAEFKLLFSINQASRPTSSHPLIKDRLTPLPATVRSSTLSPRVLSQAGTMAMAAMTPRDPRERTSVTPYRPSAINVPYRPDPGRAAHSPPILSATSTPAITTHLDPASSSIDQSLPQRRWSDASSHGGMGEVFIGHEIDDIHAEAMMQNNALLQASRMSRDSSSAANTPAKSPKEVSLRDSQPAPGSFGRESVFGTGADIGAVLQTSSDTSVAPKVVHVETAERQHMPAEAENNNNNDNNDDDDEEEPENGAAGDLVIHGLGASVEASDSESGLENYDLGGLSYYLPATPEAPRGHFYNL